MAFINFFKKKSKNPALKQERLQYRVEIFRYILEKFTSEHYHCDRILEIGPKDGLDTARFSLLAPKEIVLIDLPEKTIENNKWLPHLTTPFQYIEGNFMYMTPEFYSNLGLFNLIWCTGVLYHNPEQLRLLRRLYNLIIPGGYLVLESATIRDSKIGSNVIEKGCLVEIWYPDTYRDTGTVTHLPSKGAVKAWLIMAGFKDITDIPCYIGNESHLKNVRMACIARKGFDDDGGSYYAKSQKNPQYIFGEST